MNKYGEPCILEDRLCTECGECDRCELDPEKICDNCCKCIDSDAEYRAIEIEDILLNTEDLKSPRKNAKTTQGFRMRKK